MAETICIPMKVDAFVLNPDVCNGPDAKIAPITQPNYTFLRLDSGLIQSDVLDHVDLHASTPSQYNRRLMDVGKNEPHPKRQGVYISWTLPRVYRSGTAATRASRTGQGFPKPVGEPDPTAPTFRSLPTRWMVVRKVIKSDPPNVLPPVQGWVIDSDWNWKNTFDNLDEDADMQVDFSPFVYTLPDLNQIDQQAEVFIGRKTVADQWTEGNMEDSRVPLTLLNSANPLFADFQPHNANVFSMLDQFKYGPDDALQVNSATASYYVIGWHSLPAAEVFAMAATDNTTLGDRLSECMMTLPFLDSDPVVDWKKNPDGTQLLCHGAMYEVEWSTTGKPATVLADKDFLALNKNQPVAVGSTPLDALFSYISANIGGETDQDRRKVEYDLDLIQSLLVAQDDGVDSLLEAKDQLYSHNFNKGASGRHWHISGDDGSNKPSIPDLNTQAALQTLNDYTMAQDTAARRAKQLQWDLFGVWWKYLSDKDQQSTTGKQRFSTCVAQLSKRLSDLNTQISNLDPVIKAKSEEFPALVCGVQEPFYEQRDPTLLVAGVQPGWPVDFMDNLIARIDSQVVTDTTGIGIDPDIAAFIDNVVPKVFKTYSRLESTAQKLLREFSLLQPESKAFKIADDQAAPLYHDQGGSKDSTAPWRDRWEQSQPWLPLFLEWEVEYTHIPYEWWILEPRPVGGQNTLTWQTRYGMRDDKIIYRDMQNRPNDTRTLSGRVLMLPQPGFSLQRKLNQLFLNDQQEVVQNLSVDEQSNLLAKLSALPMVSAPMTGLTDHLITQAPGSHIKPNVRPVGSGVTPMPAAYAQTEKDMNLGKTELELVGIESDLTPYSAIIQGVDLPVAAFKPCTHGQFKFSKLNIIDRFGQAIHAIDPNPSKTAPPPLNPCVSDYYTCQKIYKSEEPNTVAPPGKGKEYVQLNPQINQLSRLNLAFVKTQTENDLNWMPVNEWDTAVWGWLVINYADYGLQVFLPTGKFYLEVRLGGPAGTAVSPDPWKPFDPPTQPEDTKQLDYLVQQLRNPDYLQSFFDMIDGAFKNLPPAPNSYAQYLSAIIGKPLALVNFGVSLELATDPCRNQSLRNIYKDRIPLLPPGSLPQDYQPCDPDPIDPPVTNPPDDPPPNYTFEVKLGDQNRVYDGLIGYYEAYTEPKLGLGQVDLTQLYTYFPSSVESTSNPTREISKNPLPTVTPFYLRPDGVDPSLFAASRNSKMRVFSAIMDPFTALHAYTGILPIGALKLPPWVVQDALTRITAFFHVGPLLSTVDVPGFNSTYEPKDAQDEVIYDKQGMGIPNVPVGQWAWLQPYMEPDTTSTAATAADSGPPPGPVQPQGADDTLTTRFMAMKIDATDAAPRYEDAPYTTVEGYLQLREPFTKPVP